MKKYLKEILLVLTQLFIFYLIPIMNLSENGLGMVFLIILLTLILSIIFGIISKEKIKYFYPIIVAIIFIPSVFIYYNSSALIHSVWYLVISTIGLIPGIIINKIKWYKWMKY